MPRNLVITTLPSEIDKPYAVDADVILLHAAFQVLVDFVEGFPPDMFLCARLARQGLPLPDEERRAYMGMDLEPELEDWRTVFSLYDWWKNRDHHHGLGHAAYDSMAEEQAAAQDDQKRLADLVRIRTRLWT